MTKQMNPDIRNKHSNRGHCFSDLLLVAILLQTCLFKTIHIYFLTVSMGQEFKHSLFGSSASRSHKAAIKVLARAVVSSETQMGKRSTSMLT